MTALKYILVSDNKKASGIFFFEDLHAQAYKVYRQSTTHLISLFLFLFTVIPGRH